jgi:CubicO group peptidase (beta-lactamase class C family)
LKYLIQFFCMLLAAPALAADDPAPRIAALLQAQGLAGAVWSTPAGTGAAGLSDVQRAVPMRTDQRVHVGSVAKTVLATGILRLVSERRLTLDTPVAGLLPGMAFDNPWADSDPVRVRHLIDHTAGLDDARFWHVFTLQAGPDVPLAAAFPAGHGLLRVRSKPGTRFSYSNLGYTLLGMVIETVTRQRYERYLDTALLAPLGMQDSTVAFVTQAADARLAMGHFEHGAPHAAVPSFVRPAGQFTTTAADMGRFARFLMSDGRIAGQPFIDAALLRRMGEPTTTEAARAGLAVGYGLGLRRIDRHGVVATCHAGNGIGFRANLCLLPATQQAFFVAVNTDSETADYQRLDELLLRQLAGPAPVSTPTALGGPAPGSWEGIYVPAPNRFHSLRLLDTLLHAVHVGGSGTVLRLRSPQAATVELRHAGGSLWQAPSKLLPSHVLLRSAEGRRVLSTGTQSWEQVSLPYWLALWCSVVAGLAGLVHVLAATAVRARRRQLSSATPLLTPCAGVLALLLPLPLLLRQSFLQLGDMTAATILLAVVTAALPVAMLAGLAMAWRTGRSSRAEVAAMVAVLQLSALLAAWGLLPLRLWV